MSSNCFSDILDKMSLWSVDSIITSWAPMPFILSYTPSPSLLSSPSIRRAGYLFGTTLSVQPDIFGFEPSGLYASISCGVLSSFPGQNGQKPSFVGGWWTINSEGLLPRSVEMITHLPSMGSFLSSGITY